MNTAKGVGPASLWLSRGGILPPAAIPHDPPSFCGRDAGATRFNPIRASYLRQISVAQPFPRVQIPE